MQTRKPYARFALEGGYQWTLRMATRSLIRPRREPSTSVVVTFICALIFFLTFFLCRALWVLSAEQLPAAFSSPLFRQLPVMLFRFLFGGGIATGVVAAALALPYSSSATLLYVSSYAGTITTLSLSLPASSNATGEGHLRAIASTQGCAPNPSWLTLDYPKSILYCADEGLTGPNGTLSSYKTSENGTLVQLDKIDTLSGPVSTVIYGTGGRGLALAE
jgi:hypothetical protein